MLCVPDGRVNLGDFSLTALDAGVDLQPRAQAAGHDAVISHRDDNTDPASPWHAGCSGTRKSHDLEWSCETHVSSSGPEPLPRLLFPFFFFFWGLFDYI